ncbi:MAG: plasmid stabilization protein [Sulfuricellaceae bacterium]
MRCELSFPRISLPYRLYFDYNACIAITLFHIMASLTIRNFDDQVKTLLRLQAAHHGCSMEQEARDILRRAVQVQRTGVGFAQKIHQRFAGLNADELPIPERRMARLPDMPAD